jgi:hypothetical protein
MRLIFSITFLFAVFMSNQVFAAATVFFKDGSKEVGNSAWIEGNSIYLNKSNEVYEYSPNELNMEETLRYNRIGKYADVTIPDSKPMEHHKKFVNQRNASQKKKSKFKPAKNNVQLVDGISTTDYVPDSRPFFGVPIPEDSTACTPELQDELLARYSKYNLAAEAGDFSEFQKHITTYQAEVTKNALAGLSKKELQKRKKVLQEMAVKNYRATACMFSPSAATAAVAGRGKNMFRGELVDAHGTISFKNENQSWKVQTTVWNQSM